MAGIVASVLRLVRMSRPGELGLGVVAGSVGIDGHRFDSSALSTRCGVRAGGVHASWPVAEMMADDTHIRIRSVAIDDIGVDRDDVSEVRVRRRLLGAEMTIEPMSGLSAVVFLRRSDTAALLGGLRLRDWPVRSACTWIGTETRSSSSAIPVVGSWEREPVGTVANEALTNDRNPGRTD